MQAKFMKYTISCISVYLLEYMNKASAPLEYSCTDGIKKMYVAHILSFNLQI